MQNLGQYILSVGLAALLIAILTEFSDKKSTTGMITRMICGLFLAFTVINPLTDLDFEILESFSEEAVQGAQPAVAAGTSLAEESMRQIIKQETEAYILDKARSLGFDLEPDVTVGDGACPVPESVRITGSIPTKSRNQLAEEFEKELGISKENQIWTG